MFDRRADGMAFNLRHQSSIRSVIPQSGVPRPQNCETWVTDVPWLFDRLALSCCALPGWLSICPRPFVTQVRF